MSSPPPMDEARKNSGSNDSEVRLEFSSTQVSLKASRTVSSPSQLDSGQESSFQVPSSSSSPGFKHVSLPKLQENHNPPHLRVSVMSTRSTTSVDTSMSLNTEYNGPIIPPVNDAHLKRRTVVICFDGTGDEFDANNSNIVQFFSVLKKGDRNRQIVYYQVIGMPFYSPTLSHLPPQSGIGTYTIPQVATKLYTNTSKTLDLMFAKYLNFHVMGGYKFLMENCEWCIFTMLLTFSKVCP